MNDAETKARVAELVQQIQDKSVELSDLEIILEDYARERRELLREIGELKASLWELIGDDKVPRIMWAKQKDALDEENGTGLS